MESQNQQQEYGKKYEYDPLWQGPMHIARRLTDQRWLIAFLVFFILYMAIGIYGLAAGLGKADHPADHIGRRCGFDLEVKDKPYLYQMDIEDVKNYKQNKNYKPTSVCLSKCPTENFIYNRSINSLADVKEKLICTTEINKDSIISFDQIDILISQKRCKKWYLKTKSVNFNCINNFEGDNNAAKYEFKRSKSSSDGAGEYLNKMFKGSVGVSISATIIGGILAILYIIALKLYAVQLVYATFSVICIMITVGLVFLIKLYVETKISQYLVATILFIVALVAIILLIIYKRKNIYLAAQLIKESSKAVLKIPATLIFPIVPFLFYALVIAFSLSVFISLSAIRSNTYRIESIGSVRDCLCASNVTYHPGAQCDPIEFDKQCHVNGQCLFMNCRLQESYYPSYLYFFHAINLFGFYWTIFFVTGVQFMILSGTFGTWYWTFDKRSLTNGVLLKSTYKMIRYHLGTVAIGSLILAIVQMIRALIQYLRDSARQANNVCATIIAYCFACIWDLIEAFISFLTFNAYIMSSIHGDNFCQGAKNSFHLIKRNLVNVVVVNSIASWVFAIAALIISGLMLGAVAIHINYLSSDLPNGTYLLTWIGTILITTTIFSVHRNAIDTIFLCYLEDTERNDGTTYRPYYMNDKLRQLLHKDE